MTHAKAARNNAAATRSTPRCLACGTLAVGGWQFLCGGCGGQLAFDNPFTLYLDTDSRAGRTPLHAARTLGAGRLWLKDEGRNPTGSFKDRTSGTAVAAAKACGARGIALYSCGNAGRAAAAAAARLGLRCLVLALPSISPTAAGHIQAYGAHLVPVDVDLSTLWTSGEIASLQDALWRDGGWFPLNRLSAPLRANPSYLAGAASMAAEIVHELGEMPAAIVAPAGSGDLLLGLWLAFQRLAVTSGSRPPQMVAVQADGAAPLVRAWERGLQHIEPISSARTIASGIEIVTGSDEALAAVRASGGSAAMATDEEIREAMSRLARGEGVLTSPEGAAAAVVADRLAEEQAIRPIVVILTATGASYPALLPTHIPAVCPTNPAAVLEIAGSISSRPD